MSDIIPEQDAESPQTVEKKDKKKVIGEHFDEDALRKILTLKPYDETPTDFYILQKAYRGLPLDAFAEFLELFRDEGHDLRSTDANGQSFLAHLQQHSLQKEYVELYQKLLSA